MHVASVTASTAPRPLWVEAADGARDLDALAPAWEALAADAVEPNVFYEPWMLLPALESFAGGNRPALVLVWGSDEEAPEGPPVLHGLFPLERRNRWRGLPVSAARLWRHTHCYLCTPLIRRGRAGECLTALFRWLRRDGAGAAILEAELTASDGPFAALIDAAQADRGGSRFIQEESTRAVWRPRGDGRPDRPAALSATRRRTLERKQRRLAEVGRLEYVVLPPDGDVRGWIDAFLKLETDGWKGRAGTALACNDADRRFFTAATTAAFARGRLLAHGLYLDGRSVALRCSFLAGDGAFAFKTAYDEAFARFSPGVLLELANLRRLAGQSAVRWMDSCTAADNFVINGLWDDRRALRSLIVSTGRWAGDLLVGLLPYLSRLKRALWPGRPVAAGIYVAAEDES